MAEARIFIRMIVIYLYWMARQSPLSDMVVRVMLMHSTLRSQVVMSLSVFMKVLSPGQRLKQQGFEVYTAAEAAKKADIIMILINDEKQADTV